MIKSFLIILFNLLLVTTVCFAQKRAPKELQKNSIVLYAAAASADTFLENCSVPAPVHSSADVFAAASFVYEHNEGINWGEYKYAGTSIENALVKILDLLNQDEIVSAGQALSLINLIKQFDEHLKYTDGKIERAKLVAEGYQISAALALAEQDIEDQALIQAKMELQVYLNPPLVGFKPGVIINGSGSPTEPYAPWIMEFGAGGASAWSRCNRRDSKLLANEKIKTAREIVGRTTTEPRVNIYKDDKGNCFLDSETPITCPGGDTKSEKLVGIAKNGENIYEDGEGICHLESGSVTECPNGKNGLILVGQVDGENIYKNEFGKCQKIDGTEVPCPCALGNQHGNADSNACIIRTLDARVACGEALGKGLGIAWVGFKKFVANLPELAVSAASATGTAISYVYEGGKLSFIVRMPGLDPAVRQQAMQDLSNRANEEREFFVGGYSRLVNGTSLLMTAMDQKYADFDSYSFRNKLNLVCQGFGVAGPEIIMATLASAVSVPAKILKIKQAMRLKDGNGVELERKKNQNVTEKSNGQEIKDQGLVRATAEIDALEHQADELYERLSRQKKSGTATEQEIAATVREIESVNSRLSHMRTANLIEVAGSKGMIHLDEVVGDGKILNEIAESKGRYPPWSEGGPVYKVTLKKDIELCRGGSYSELARPPGSWFIPCLKEGYRSKEKNKWVNATAENPYDVYTRWKLKAGDEVYVGGINPIIGANGKAKVFGEHSLFGGGGEVQIQRIRKSADDVLTQDRLVRWVHVLDNDSLLPIQESIKKASGSTSELRRIRQQVLNIRGSSRDRQHLLDEIDEFLSGEQRSIPMAI
jgi:hypothetical protein